MWPVGLQLSSPGRWRGTEWFQQEASGELYASLTASRGLGEDKILTPWYPFTGVNHPALCITEISWADKATTQISMSSCLLYLFIIAIKKKPKQKQSEWIKQVQKSKQTSEPDAVWKHSHYHHQAWEDVTARSKAVQPQRDELLLRGWVSRREKEGEKDTMEHLSTSAQCVVINSRMQAIFPQRPQYVQLL